MCWTLANKSNVKVIPQIFLLKLWMIGRIKNCMLTIQISYVISNDSWLISSLLDYKKSKNESERNDLKASKNTKMMMNLGRILTETNCGIISGSHRLLNRDRLLQKFKLTPIKPHSFKFLQNFVTNLKKIPSLSIIFQNKCHFINK